MRRRAAPAKARGQARSHAFRAPLAERSAVNRQVLGSIPSGGEVWAAGAGSRPSPSPRGSSVVEQWTVKCSMQLSIGREFKSPSPEPFAYAWSHFFGTRTAQTPGSIFGLVGYDACFTRKRSRVRSSEDVVFYFCLYFSRKRWVGTRQTTPVRKASQSIKIFESNLGNDQPQGNLMTDERKKKVKVLL